MLRLSVRAQVAFEFVMLVGILFAALMIFASFVRDNFSDVQTDTDFFKLKDLAISVQTELLMAASLQDGYERQFFIPFTIDGLEYEINSTSNILTFQSENAEYAVTAPTYNGTLQKGNNIIRKNAGLIEVN